jgi:hypothetical protein
MRALRFGASVFKSKINYVLLGQMSSNENDVTDAVIDRAQRTLRRRASAQRSGLQMHSLSSGSRNVANEGMSRAAIFLSRRGKVAAACSFQSITAGECGIRGFGRYELAGVTDLPSVSRPR